MSYEMNDYFDDIGRPNYMAKHLRDRMVQRESYKPRSCQRCNDEPDYFYNEKESTSYQYPSYAGFTGDKTTGYEMAESYRMEQKLESIEQKTNYILILMIIFIVIFVLMFVLSLFGSVMVYKTAPGYVQG